MAETFLSPVIEKLIDFLADEVKSLKGVHEEVQSLKDELEIIQPFLVDAEAKSEKGETSNAVKAWVNQIRVQAERIEGVIDKHHYNQMRIHYEKGFMRKTGQFFKSLKSRHEIASEIETIKKSLSEIRARGKGYGLRPLDQAIGGREEHVDPRLESLLLKEDEVVGIESTKNDLVAKLVNGPSDCLVISLVGEGGIGKTTLAKTVFDDEAVKQHFGSAFVWITVSQQYNLKTILRTMKAKMCTERECSAGEMEEIDDLICCLNNYLQRRRYVIVFDDVWEKRFWDDIKLALPSNKEGSRIIITTRNGSVADYCKKSAYNLIQDMKPWSPTLAFELFCKRAFQYEFEGSCPDELLELSKEIVSKCQGLPLVIAAIAGLLATKEKVILEWQRVLKDLNSKCENNSELTRVHKIISLSYYDLPLSLRYCYLCFCMFPEDHLISTERLYQLWIAEGFVKGKGEKALEEVAEEYMGELIKRNLVLSDPWNWNEENKLFKVHDLMRDIILLKAEETCFCQIWDSKEMKFEGNSRRLAITGSGKTALEKVDSSVVRSVFISNADDELLTESSMITLFEKFKLLHVLNVQSSRIDSLPKEVGNLLCLKYLSLRGTNVESLPKSISNLQNLYSLDIRHTPIKELPNEIKKLKKLRHIQTYNHDKNCRTPFDYLSGVRLREGFGELEDLETLTTVDVDVRLGGGAIIKELEKLTKLKWLAILKLTTELGNALCAAIEKMNRLQRLTICSVDENNVMDVQHISSPPLQLRNLILCGRLERVPEWIRNLSVLTLVSSRFICNDIEPLKVFPNLKNLCFQMNAYEGEELHFEEGSFVKLKSLKLYKLDNLKAVKIDQRALPLLERLSIEFCPLKESPAVQHLKSIKVASVNGKDIIKLI